MRCGIPWQKTILLCHIQKSMSEVWNTLTKDYCIMSHSQVNVWGVEYLDKRLLYYVTFTGQNLRCGIPWQKTVVLCHIHRSMSKVWNTLTKDYFIMSHSQVNVWSVEYLDKRLLYYVTFTGQCLRCGIPWQRTIVSCHIHRSMSEVWSTSIV